MSEEKAERERETGDIPEEDPEEKQFYMEAIRRTVDSMSELLGEDIGLKYARKAPLQVTKEGEVEDYYGTGKKALKILKENYESYMGAGVADSKIRSALSDMDLDEDQKQLLPENLRPDPSEKQSLFSKARGIV